MKKHCLILGTFFLLIVSGNVRAASFDCEKAASEVEKIICAEAELSRLYESLSEAYLQALKRTGIRDEIIKSQKQWLTNVRNACKNAECIRKAYETRINELGSSSHGITSESPTMISASPGDPPTHASRSRAIEQPGETIQTQLEQQREAMRKWMRRYETELSVNDQLVLATERGSLELAKTLVGKGGDVNAGDPYGRTVLMSAVHSGNFDLVKFPG